MTTKAAQLLTAVKEVGQEFDRRVSDYALSVCIYPAKPWHITQKQAAIASFRHYLSCKRLGLLSKREQDSEFNRCTKATNDAIFYHRLNVMKNTAAQTFGRAI